MLLPILGTSWVFGVLAVNNRAVVFQYVFAVLNSLQVGAAGPWARAVGPAALQWAARSRLSGGRDGLSVLCPPLGTPLTGPAPVGDTSRRQDEVSMWAAHVGALPSGLRAASCRVSLW